MINSCSHRFTSRSRTYNQQLHIELVRDVPYGKELQLFFDEVILVPELDALKGRDSLDGKFPVSSMLTMATRFDQTETFVGHHEPPARQADSSRVGISSRSAFRVLSETRCDN